MGAMSDPEREQDSALPHQQQYPMNLKELGVFARNNGGDGDSTPNDALRRGLDPTCCRAGRPAVVCRKFVDL